LLRHVLDVPGLASDHVRLWLENCMGNPCHDPPILMHACMHAQQSCTYDHVRGVLCTGTRGPWLRAAKQEGSYCHDPSLPLGTRFARIRCPLVSSPVVDHHHDSDSVHFVLIPKYDIRATSDHRLLITSIKDRSPTTF
jgi:hypothetical protein